MAKEEMSTLKSWQQGIPCKKESNHDCIRDQSSFPCLHLFSCCIEIDDNRRRTCDINHSKQHHKSGEYLLYTQMQIHLYKLYELYFGVYRPQVILINHETTPKYFLTTAGTAKPGHNPYFQSAQISSSEGTWIRADSGAIRVIFNKCL